ncbi:MAG TPA: hypothetical protein VJT71_15660, partial [Pyrinomonadaceae bacterium]|nr:hypothetical protein [Pyrinomonadaceae bacterium]
RPICPWLTNPDSCPNQKLGSIRPGDNRVHVAEAAPLCQQIELARVRAVRGHGGVGWMVDNSFATPEEERLQLIES